MEQEIETVETHFRCTWCWNWIPLHHQSRYTPFGASSPICDMCVSYGEYLREWDYPDDEYEDE